MKRYFVKTGTKDGDIAVTEFELTIDLSDGRIEHSGYAFYHEDFGNGQWFGGVGYLADPDEYFTEMKSHEVAKGVFDDAWNKAKELSNE